MAVVGLWGAGKTDRGHGCTVGPILTIDDPALAPSSDTALAIATVAAYEPDDDAQRRMRDEMLRRARDDGQPLARTTTAHLTGSAAVLDASGSHILLTLHRRFGRWLQLGGHCDGDANLAGVALREAIEESGLEGLRIHPIPVDLDIQSVPCPPASGGWHLDVRFLVVAATRADPVVSDESDAVVWFPVDDLPGDFDASGIRLVAAARRALVRIG